MYDEPPVGAFRRHKGGSYEPYRITSPRLCCLSRGVATHIGESARAATIECGAGDTPCLIAAINEANAGPQHKTRIRLAGGTYALTTADNITNGLNGLPSIVREVTIEAGSKGATLARASSAPAFRLLHVGASGHLTLDRVRLTGGDVSFSIDGRGGALLNDRGIVTITHCSFDGNTAGEGGAVYTNHGTMTISDSTIFGNFGLSGGGLFNIGGTVTLTRTEVDGNAGTGVAGFWTEDGETHISQSRFHGGGTFIAGGLYVRGGTASISETTFSRTGGDPSGAIFVDKAGTLVVQDSAFVENAGKDASSIFNLDGTVTVINTTFADAAGALSSSIVLNDGSVTIVNSTLVQKPDRFGSLTGSIIGSVNATTRLQNMIVGHGSEDPNVLACFGVVISLGNNLISDPSGCTITLQPSDLIGDAGLGALVDDGTPGNAHFPLLPTSQAIDAANDKACPKTDQIRSAAQTSLRYRRGRVTARGTSHRHAMTILGVTRPGD